MSNTAPAQAFSHVQAPRRIVHVTEALGGGVLDVVRNLAVQQAAAGFDVHLVYAPRAETPRTQELERMMDGVTLRPYCGQSEGLLRRLFGMARGIAKAVRGDDPTVLHLHSSYAGAAGRAWLRRGTPSLHTFYTPHGFAHLRGDRSRLSRWAYARIEAALSRRGAGIVAVSESEARIARALGAKRVDVLRNRVRVDELPDRAPRDPDAPMVIGNLARVTPQKGFGRFAEIADRLKGQAKFVWVGGGAAIGEWELKRSGCEVTGWVDRAVALDQLSGFDVLLFTSYWEGMPIALMEAQAMGIPVIAFDCPGVDDVVVDGVTGFIVSTVDAAEACVLKLSGDPELRQRMARDSRSRGKQFDVQGYAEDSLRLYSRMAAWS